jgi:hypothetical protein
VQQEKAASTNSVVRAYCWSDGAGWGALGGGTVASSSVSMSPRALAFDANGAPFVGWSRGGIIEAAYWGGSQWNVSVVHDGVTVGYRAAELAVDPTLGVVAGSAERVDVRGARGCGVRGATAAARRRI